MSRNNPEVRKIKTELGKLKTLLRLIESKKKKVKKLSKHITVVYVDKKGKDVERELKNLIREGEALLITHLLEGSNVEISGDTVFISDDMAEHISVELDKARLFFESVRNKKRERGEGGE